MKFLLDFANQMRDMFMSLTPAARVVTGLLSIAILVSMGFLFQGSRSVATEYLFSGKAFSDTEITRFEVAFSSAALRDYEVVGSRIKVPAGTRDQYIKALSDADALPVLPGAGGDSLKSVGILDSNRMLEIKVKESKEKEIAGWVSKLPGINWATVDYSEQRQGFGRQMVQTASVVVEPIAAYPLSEERLREIAKMVAASFAGLKPENVRVMDVSSGRSTAPTDGVVGGEDDPYLKQQRIAEESYRRRIRELLTPYGDIRLEVGVILDDTVVSESQQLKYDTQPTTIEMTSSRKDLESTKANSGGQPGTEPNALGNRSATLATADQSSKTKETSENERRVVGQEVTRTAKAGLVPKRVSASVGLPESYIRKAIAARWVQSNPEKPITEMPNPTQAEIDTAFKDIQRNIQTAIAAILPPVAAGDDRFELVSVYPYTEVAPEAPPLPTFTSQMLQWLNDSWQTLALLMVVTIAMGMVLSMSRSKNNAADDPFKDGFGIALVDKIKDNLDISVDADSGESRSGDSSDPSTPGGKGRKVEVTGQELKENLSSMIQENPDAAVNLIRTWIGEAA
jgi:flagellar M-ring protein FliF